MAQSSCFQTSSSATQASILAGGVVPVVLILVADVETCPLDSARPLIPMVVP